MTVSTLANPGLVKPLPSEIDVFGLTHQGHVRRTNADHFLIASFHRAMCVHASNVASDTLARLATDSRGYLLLVADGVGGLARAEEGSAHAVHSIAQYILDMGEICLQTEPAREAELVARLRTSVIQAHESLLELGEETGAGTAATTLTMLIAMWPRAFVIHAGDSRCYRLRDGTLQRMTTDQTMAQMLIDSGALNCQSAEASRFKHVLISALGSPQLDAQVTVADHRRTDMMLLCTDGLTRHVSDAEIGERLASRAGAEAICRGLVGLALDRGGEDNVTVVVGYVRDA